MGIETALIVAAGAMAAGTAYSIYSGEQQASAQRKAMDQQRDANNRQLQAQQESLAQQKEAQATATAAAEKQAKTAEEATNRSLAKTPNSSAILSQAEQASKTGVGSTMLTGPSGVDPASLSLDKKTLLGA